MAKAKPPIPRCTRIFPVPRHLRHTSAVVPWAQPVPRQVSQLSSRVRDSSLAQPAIASAKEMVMLARREEPRWGALGSARREPPKPPPKKEPKMSPRSMSPMSKPPKPPPPKLGSTPAWPNWSYLARLSLSDSTS